MDHGPVNRNNYKVENDAHRVQNMVPCYEPSVLGEFGVAGGFNTTVDWGSLKKKGPVGEVYEQIVRFKDASCGDYKDDLTS